MSNLQARMQKLADIADVETYYAPPTRPSPQVSATIEDFLRTYPFVQNDPGYIEFLRTYGGGVFTLANDAISIGIYGFSWRLCPHIVDQGPVVDDSGFFTYADLYANAGDVADLDRDISMAFSLDSTGERRPGVYWRDPEAADRASGDKWFCTDFMAWLDALIAHKGRLDRLIQSPPSPG